MIIAVDAAGGDYAPHEIVKGAIKAASEYNIDITLVGRRNVLHVLMGRQLQKAGISIVNASQTIDFDEHPLQHIGVACRHFKNLPDDPVLIFQQAIHRFPNESLCGIGIKGPQSHMMSACQKVENAGIDFHSGLR